jgi:SAM-dependent methyltransferase
MSMGGGAEMTDFWTDADTATEWARLDAQADFLAAPRAIAAEIVALDRPDTGLVVDIGSGPGDFLAVFLSRLPQARGEWTDVSDVMESMARDRLAPYIGRVAYRIMDMTDLSDVPMNVDAIVTSRAVHHLDRAGLHEFYREAARHLAPGGWLVNLDHIGPTEQWDTRLRSARGQLIPRTGEQHPHHHVYPLTSIADHLDALRAAGFTDPETPWRAFVTCLFMARRHA